MSDPITAPSIKGPEGRNPVMLVVYSGEKVGKTTACAAIPDSVLWCIDPNGAHYVTARKLTRERELKSYTTFLAHCRQAKEDRLAGKPWGRYGVLDNLSELEEWAFQMALDEHNKSPAGMNNPLRHINELPGPKGSMGWGRMRDAFSRLRTAFELAYPGKDPLSGVTGGVIYIAHMRDSKPKMDKLNATGPQQVSTDDIEVSGVMREVICRQASGVGYFHRGANGADGSTTLMLTFKTTDNVRCSSRCPHLDGKTFTIGTRKGLEEPVMRWDEVFLAEEAKP